MENYCGSCGAPVQENFKVCGNCGTPVAQAPQAPEAPQAAYVPYQQPVEMQNNKPENNKKIITLGAAALAVIVIIAIIAGIAGGGYKKPIKNMAKSFEEADFDMFIECFAEEKLDDFGGDETQLEFYVGVIYDYLEDECGEGYKVKVEYNDKEKLDKDDIEEFIEDLEEDEGIEYDEDEIANLYIVDVTLTAEGDDNDVVILEGELYVSKYDGEWVVVNMDMEFECEDGMEEYFEENADKYYDDLMGLYY